MKIKNTAKMLIYISTIFAVFFTTTLNSAANFDSYSDSIIEKDAILSDNVATEEINSESQEEKAEISQTSEASEAPEVVPVIEDKPSIIYRETFENFDRNNPPKNWSITQTNDPGLAFSIEENIGGNTSKVFAMERDIDKTAGGSAVVTFPPQTGVVSISFKLYHEGNTRKFMELRSDGQRFERITFNDNARLLFNDRGIEVMRYNRSQWYDIKVVVNTEKGTSDVYVDGELLKSGIKFWSPNNNRTISDLSLSAWTDRGDGFLYLDDLVIENEAYNMVRDDMDDLTFTTEEFYKYSFEDEVTGSQPENWNIHYYEDDPLGTYAKVAKNVGDNNTKVLEIYRPEMGEGINAAVSATKNFEPLDGVVEAGFKYYRNSSMNTTFSLFNELGEFERLTFKYDEELDENILLINDSNNNDIKIKFINNKEWFDIKLFLDIDKQTIDVYVNGMLKADDVDIWKKDILEQSKVLSKIAISYEEDNGNGKDYFDDIYIGKVIPSEEWKGSYELTGDIFLPSIGFNGSEITWESDNPDFIDNKGSVVRPLNIEGDQAVTLTATLVFGGNRVTKDFNVTVLKHEALTDAEKVFLDKEALTLEETTNVTDDVYLPDKGGIYGSTITWRSNNPSVISHDGKVKRPAAGKGDAVVTLTANLKLGNAIETKYFNIEVLELRESTRRGGGGGGRSVSVARLPEVPVIIPDTSVNLNSVKFNDLDSVDWARESIEKLAEKGIVKGLGNSVFGPNDNVTREQFIQMLMNAFNLVDYDAQADFNDVDKDAWYYRSVATAKKLNIISGYPDGSFGVGKEITREEMAAMVYRTAEFKGIHFEQKVEPAEFNDEEEISAYAKSAVQAMQKAGIIRGMSESEFAPNLNATRAQAAKIIFESISMAQ